MIIRNMTKEDIPILECLNRKYYPEFDSPEFEGDYFTKFVIESPDKQLVMGGGLRYLAECILVTDRSKNIHTIGEALLLALQTSVKVCKMRHVEFLTAYVKNDEYRSHLIDKGFDSRGEVLSLWVPGVQEKGVKNGK